MKNLVSIVIRTKNEEKWIESCKNLYLIKIIKILR